MKQSRSNKNCNAFSSEYPKLINEAQFEMSYYIRIHVQCLIYVLCPISSALLVNIKYLSLSILFILKPMEAILCPGFAPEINFLGVLLYSLQEAPFFFFLLLLFFC